MPKKRYNAEPTIHKLRVADAMTGREKTAREAFKALGLIVSAS